MQQWEARAKAILPADVYDFFAGGAGDERTLHDSENVWNSFRFVPHVLRDVSDVDTTTTILGEEVASPVAVAPAGYLELAHSESETAVAKATASLGLLSTVSSRASTPLSDIVMAAPNGPRWFQTYILRDRSLTLELANEARELGFTALALTVDAPILGRRHRDERNGFILPPSISSGSRSGKPELQHGAETQDPSLTFDDIAWLRDATEMPVVVKGVLRADDARRCVDAGAAAVWVSSHGGRQLDGAITPADALSSVVEAIGGSAEVYVDGGIRTGRDVLRALALGARAVFVARPVVWGLAVAGAAGVGEVLDEIQADLRLSMALCGATSIDDITSDLVTRG